MTFSTIQDLIDYINVTIVPNGNNEITATDENNIENGLAQFIISSILNYDKAAVFSTLGANVVLNKGFNVFTQVPASISWNNAVWYNEFYIVNMTGFGLPLASGYVYYDAYQTAQDEVPARSVVHIAKSTNDLWVQVNNVGGGSGSLPPQTGNEGKVLTTNGTSANWISPLIPIVSADFEPDGVTYINTAIPETQFRYEVFYNDLSRFLYEGTEWNYVTGGGIEILLPGFDANSYSYNLYLFLRGLND